MDYAFEAILEQAKKKKLIKKIPEAPKSKLDLIRETFQDTPEIIDALNEYMLFKLIDILKKSKAGEFRKGVCLTVTYKKEDVQINMDNKNIDNLLNRIK